MRILLTGRHGQIGHELHRVLPALGDVYAPERRSLDLARPEAVAEAVRKLRPDLIINAAAYTAVDRAESEPELAAAVNADAPGVLAEEAARIGALLVHYSTDYVFGGSARRPYRPDDRPEPLNVYGRTKLAGERAVLAAGGGAVVVRTSWVYSTRRRNFLMSMLNRAISGGPLRVVDDERGTPTPARLIAEITAGIVAGFRDPASRPAAPEVHHLACRGETTWYGFARAIFELAGVAPVPSIEPISARQWGAPAPRPAYSVLDTDGFAERFGVEPPPWRDALARILDEDRPLERLAAEAAGREEAR